MGSYTGLLQYDWNQLRLSDWRMCWRSSGKYSARPLPLDPATPMWSPVPNTPVPGLAGTDWAIQPSFARRLRSQPPDAIPDDASSPGALSKNTNVVARPKYSCVRTGRQRAGRYSQALSINTDISRRHAFPYYTFSPGALANDAGSRAITVAFHTSHITYAIDTGARARRRQCGGKLAFARLALPIYADLVTPRDARLAGAKRSLTITERCSG